MEPDRQNTQLPGSTSVALAAENLAVPLRRRLQIVNCQNGIRSENLHRSPEVADEIALPTTLGSV